MTKKDTTKKTTAKKAPENSSNNNNLQLTIIVAAVLIASSVAYLGYMMSKNGGNSTGGDFDKRVEAGIEAYIQKQEEKAREDEIAANKPQKVDNISIDDDAILGDENAPITIVEFSDYECPFCKRANDDAITKVREKYVESGDVRIVYRDFPLSFHPNAVTAAIAAECAGDQDKYYEMHDAIFDSNQTLNADHLKELAVNIGLNTGTFNTCLDNETHKEEVEADMAEGQRYGVTGTPAFFINGWHLKGAKPFSAFEEIIEQELNK
jgi:protein-disulfide isomerase